MEAAKRIVRGRGGYAVAIEGVVDREGETYDEIKDASGAAGASPRDGAISFSLSLFLSFSLSIFLSI